MSECRLRGCGTLDRLIPLGIFNLMFCRHRRVKSRLSFLKNGRHDQSSCDVSRLQLCEALSDAHPLTTYLQRYARREHMFILESLHRTSDYARQFLDAYALPLDGTRTPTFPMPCGYRQPSPLFQLQYHTVNDRWQAVRN